MDRRLSNTKLIWLTALAVLTAPVSSYALNVQDVCSRLLFSKRPSSSISTTDFKATLFEEASRGHRPYSDYRSYMFNNYNMESSNAGSVFDVYCEDTYRAPGGRINSNKVNVEHSWPQSRFSRKFSRKLQKSDMHHLYITDSKANSIRGNHPYGIVETSEGSMPCTESRFGFDRSGRTVFEPPDAFKGAIARSLFYFSIRYKISISPEEELILRQWHEQFPVSDRELRRNGLIEKAQGNRNPFIDHPEYVGLVEQFVF